MNQLDLDRGLAERRLTDPPEAAVQQGFGWLGARGAGDIEQLGENGQQDLGADLMDGDLLGRDLQIS